MSREMVKGASLEVGKITSSPKPALNPSANHPTEAPSEDFAATATSLAASQVVLPFSPVLVRHSIH